MSHHYFHIFYIAPLWQRATEIQTGHSEAGHMKKCESAFPVKKQNISSLMQDYGGVSFISCSWQTPLTQVWTHFSHFSPVSNKAVYLIYSFVQMSFYDLDSVEIYDPRANQIYLIKSKFLQTQHMNECHPRINNLRTS